MNLNYQPTSQPLKIMKLPIQHRHLIAAVSLLLAHPSAGSAQTPSAGGGNERLPPVNAASVVNVQGAVVDATFAGTISAFSADGFTLQTAPNGAATSFLMGPDTVFTDSAGRNIPREQFNIQMPATVSYVRIGNQMLATKVVSKETPEANSSGTLTEVSPGILVIKVPGASLTPVQYVNNQTTNYVDQNGQPVSPSSVKPGTPVRVFYTKVGDTLIATKVEVNPREGAGLPIPAVIEATPTSTTTTTIERIVKP